MLNEEQYYQFFLSVLDVYGFAVINMNNGVLKVVRSKDAKTAAVPVASDAAPGIGDEVVTRVVPLTNVAARDLAPLLRQLTITPARAAWCTETLQRPADDRPRGGHQAPANHRRTRR
jgi:type II secretory pathway component GspD/PulD (secretin)